MLIIGSMSSQAGRKTKTCETKICFSFYKFWILCSKDINSQDGPVSFCFGLKFKVTSMKRHRSTKSSQFKRSIDLTIAINLTEVILKFGKWSGKIVLLKLACQTESQVKWSSISERQIANDVIWVTEYPKFWIRNDNVQALRVVDDGEILDLRRIMINWYCGYIFLSIFIHVRQAVV